MDYPIPATVIFQKSAVEQAAISGATVRPGQNHMAWEATFIYEHWTTYIVQWTLYNTLFKLYQ